MAKHRPFSKRPRSIRSTSPSTSAATARGTFSWNAKGAREQVSRPGGQDAHAAGRARERTGDFHGGAVSAECEHRIVRRPARGRQFASVPGMLGERKRTLNLALGERARRALHQRPTATRGRVGYEQHASDHQLQLFRKERPYCRGVGASPFKPSVPGEQNWAALGGSAGTPNRRCSPTGDRSTGGIAFVREAVGQ